MALSGDAVEQSTATYYDALLGGLNDALRVHGVRGRVVRVVRVRLRFEECCPPGYAPPVLEVRGADRRLRATVGIVQGASEAAYLVRLVGEALHYLFPVNEGAEALTLLVGKAQDWQMVP
ncbi:hypothetical protein [Sphaerisporangium corydalis]|uniref:Uncharacterized protein n=1 Tax=Sphaerisporangium corydalis TaxID=1441875 RepID=A0ABV9EMV4_9ACTN|nr:hypothetical protein [Sphaerisporangium corydalis]